RSGLTLSEADVVQSLNDLGYTGRDTARDPGEFATGAQAVEMVPRGGVNAGRHVRLEWTPEPAGRGEASGRAPRRNPAIARVLLDDRPVAGVALDPPLLSALANATRERRRRVPLAGIPAHVQQAVLAIEDRRFYAHPGIDPIRMLGALVTNLRGDRTYLVGASTITQQLARNFFLTQEMAIEQQSGRRSLRRKLMEQFMAVVLETKATKEEILELYLNEVYLGHRGSFALHGVAVAARTFFAKDLSNLSVAEGALIAGIIQSPGNHSPFVNLEHARDRRDVVLRAMGEAGYITPAELAAALKEPLQVVARALDFQAPYFMDVVADALAAQHPGVAQSTVALEVYTTLDLNLQRAAQDAVRDGLTGVDATLARRKRAGRPQAALVALDPRTGDLLALVGGRSYSQSQFNRATSARRQPGSVFKPFVYLAAFDKAAADGRTDVTPASLVLDEPTTWAAAEGDWTPSNYDNEYDGMITLRRALALSRNIAAIKVAEQAGFDTVAALWRRTGIGKTPLRGYPSIALGVFELTPLDVAEAFTSFATMGIQRAPRALTRVVADGRELPSLATPDKQVAAPAVTYLVTNMMRGVMSEGTAASARAAGFTFDAAGKTGTTNDLRDAWFVGFTPELLTVVWVGLDDNQILGMTGAQSALPIWTAFMKRALAGRPNVPFPVPPGISVVEVDRDTGELALPTCPRVTVEAFLEGTEPAQWCRLHQFQ
ncbi:MAG TPA: PBP1A family penicillin-binding protein, partial [Vicinamibacterales bacterium]|nr:PBP1A family penicillin-binding protein [Vicinamibacterales bacterium]